MTYSNFKLDSRLNADSDFVMDLPVSELRLMNNRAFPWLILVPRIPDSVELTSVPIEEQQKILLEVNWAGLALKEITSMDKLNIATLGNVVSQLHIHVIARNSQDVAWPKPVWGLSAVAYAESEKRTLINKLTTSIKKIAQL